MNCLQCLALLVTLASALSVAYAGLLPSDSGYQYDRPGFGTDFERRTGVDNLSGRYPGGRVTPFSGNYAGNFGNSAFGFTPGYQGNAAYPGYQNYPGLQRGGSGYQGLQGDGSRGYQGFDGSDNGRPRAYSFQYEVRDPASGNDYGQEESGDGSGSVRGEYRVLLPDSRTQVVRYAADDATGYVADVQYEGEAQYPRNGNFGVNRGPGAFFGVNGFQGNRAGVNGLNGLGGVDGFAGYNPATTAGNQYLPPSTGSYGK